MCCSRQRLLPQCGCERLASAAIAVWAPGGEGCANADEHSFSARRPPSSALAAAATTDHAAIDAAAAGLNKIATLSILAVLPRSLTLLSALDHTSPCSRVLWTEGDSYVLLVCGEKRLESARCASARVGIILSKLQANTTGRRRHPTREWGFVTNTSPMDMWYRPHRHVRVYCGRVPTVFG